MFRGQETGEETGEEMVGYERAYHHLAVESQREGAPRQDCQWTR